MVSNEFKDNKKSEQLNLYGDCLNSLYFSLLNKYENDSGIIQGIKALISKLDINEQNNYWYSFGYKYGGLLSYTNDEWQKSKNIRNVSKTNNDVALKVSNFIGNSKFLNIIWNLLFETSEKIDILDFQSIKTSIDNGSIQFCNDFNQMLHENVVLDEDVCIVPLVYFSGAISQYDEKNLYSILVRDGESINNNYMPLKKNGHHKFGIVYPWPGTDSAESELLERIKRAAQDIGIECIMLSDFGKVLDENQKETNQLVDGRELDFVLTTHYESHKTVDSYYYHLLWNPPEIPLNTAYYADKVVDNYLMNDDFLIYDFGGMSNHLRTILMSKPRTLDNASTFVGSFPSSVTLEPKLENPKLFYCGMNWEKALNNSNRHEGLFKLLDDTGNVKFFGPEIVESWGNVRPWEGYKCYQYSIPFDGFSILKEINECGICLAISSDIHRRAGAVTNRTYEACAAGAVLISDNNVFMEHYFKDAVLFINYNKSNPKDTFDQIMEKYQWVKDNKEEALAMAKKSQEIFKKLFAMDKQLSPLFMNHPKRFKTIEKDLFAMNENKTVLVTFVVNTLDIKIAQKSITSVIRNVENQYYRNIVVAISCDKLISDDIKEFCYIKSARVRVISMNLFDEKQSRNMTDGQAIRVLQNSTNHSYFINILSNEEWFYDHITTLVRTLEDDKQAMFAYSGILSMDKDAFRRTFFFETLRASTVFYFEHPDLLPIPGQIMFRKECHDYVPDYVLDCLDGLEHCAYIVLLWFKNDFKSAFSKRMTNVYKYYIEDKRNTVLSNDMQVRFIQGMVKYDLPVGGLSDNAMGGKVMMDRHMKQFVSHFPVRAWLKLRMLRIRLRHINKDSESGKKLLGKYEETLKEYNNTVI